MKTGLDKLMWAIEFSRLDLDKITVWQWQKLREELSAFFMAGDTLADTGGIGVFPLQAPMPDQFRESDFRSLQRRVRELFDQLRTSRTMEGRLLPIPIVAHYTLLTMPGERPVHFLTAHGSTSDMVVLTSLHLLHRESSDKISRCPECQQIFIRKPRQAYCSRTCVNRANQQAHRDRQQVAKHKRATRQRRTKKQQVRKISQKETKKHGTI